MITQVTRDEAKSLRDRIQADDPEWTYLIAESPTGWVVAVYDEEGIYLGTVGDPHDYSKRN